MGASFAACDIGGDNDDHNDDKDNDEEEVEGAEVLRWLASVRPAFKDLYGAKMVEQGYEGEKRRHKIDTRREMKSACVYVLLLLLPQYDYEYILMNLFSRLFLSINHHLFFPPTLQV